MWKKIDTRQGTKNSFALSHGNCLPLTGLPFGANYFAVETGSGAWWFDPDAEHYHGFRLTHQATVWGGPEGDYCSLGLLPFSTPNRGIIDVPFEPAESAFHPDRLTIRQANADLTTTLVPTMYGAALETTSGFADLGLIISFPSTGALTRVDGQVIEGYTLQRHALAGHTAKQYFHLEASRSVEQRTTLPNGQEMLDFAPASEALTLRLGTSYISPEFAVRNMPTASLTALAQAARKAWQEKLVKVEVTSRNQDQVKTFYHMMYRAFLFPERMYELDENGQPVHRDLYANQVRPGFLYTGTGTWDMARTTYPLYSLIETDEYEQILSGFLNSYRESGYLPKWLNPQDNGGMSGNLIEAVIADAAVKAVAKDKMPAFLDALLAGAEQQDPQGMRGRRYADDYRKLGYIPGNIRESVNNTLDYSYGDFCISVVAKIVGNSEVYDQYRPGGLNYRQLFSKKAGFMVAKEPDGQFRQDFKDTSWTRDYTEGSAWQSTFAVPHDIQGLINLYGGNQPFLAVLSRLANSQPLTMPVHGITSHTK
ncbi:glycoside hydrolase domain-containing protein [Lacticaseibacillus camelliae]|uniref:glycoside hydrolase domain-containing protein n=1 Tax=Lacticaseibacillus camelliae TaxID=381742 RepID=UPI000A59D72E|nr:glycoside hydrolase domain-containing protein [Lacticaseibacillus camelliae]